MVAPQRLSPRAGPAPWPRMAHHVRSHQLSAVHVCGEVGGWTLGSHPFTLRIGTSLGKISCLPRSHKEAGHWPGTAPRPWEGTGNAGWCSPFTPLGIGVQGRASKGSPFSMQSMHPDAGKKHRVELGTPGALAGPLSS